MPPEVHRTIQKWNNIRVERLPIRIREVVLLAAFVLVPLNDGELALVEDGLHHQLHCMLGRRKDQMSLERKAGMREGVIIGMIQASMGNEAASRPGIDRRKSGRQT